LAAMWVRVLHCGKQENCPAERITLEASFKEQQARFVKIRLTDVRKIPNWHRGKGAPASLFIDEIGVY